ncbi:hypothetical protein HOP50_16g77760 [Chloropicon primus]|nr:hypothetical protein HOP50_16g77760 [Chloropicon primus]
MRRAQGGGGGSTSSSFSSSLFSYSGVSRQVQVFHLLALCIGVILGYAWISFALGSSRSHWKQAHVSDRHVDTFPGVRGGGLAARESVSKPQLGGGETTSTRRGKAKEAVGKPSGKASPAKEERKRSIFRKIGTTLAGAKNKQQQQQRVPKPSSSGKYHMVVTTDSNVYNSWQVQACYYWYKKMKQQHPESDLGGFTRLLHTGREDDLMDVIPTVVVDPEPEEKHRGYKVLNRPWAFQQFLERTNISEEYIFMSEPDHLLLKPMPNWATETTAAAFPFHYMRVKDDPKHKPLVAHFNDKNVSLDKIFPTGNSPVIINKHQMLRVAPVWRDLAFRIDTYKPTKEYWGWVLEMWAFTISCSQQDPPVEFDLHPEFMLQTPWDKTPQINVCDPGGKGCQLKDGYILHYTYGVDYDENGESIYGKLDENGRIVLGKYRFDKREYAVHYPTLQTVKLLEHPRIKKEAPLSYRQVEMIREAIPWMKVTTNKQHHHRRG